MLNKRTLPIIFFLLSCLFTQAQISVTPAQPSDQDSITLLFNASQGSGGLAGYTGDVYAHTGVITNLSTSPSDWKYVKAGWGVNIPACKLTSLGNNLWQLKIGPDIRQYYGVPASEEIYKMAFVFRSGVQVGGAYLEGKAAGGGDIFWNVYPSGLSVKFLLPADPLVITTLNASVTINISSYLADTTRLYYNNQLVASSTGNTLNYNLTASTYGLGLVKTIARNDTGMVSDSFYLFVRQPVTVEPVPAGIHEGINYLSDTSLILCLNAPLKSFVFAIGDFSNWQPWDGGYMKKDPDNKRFWVQINGLIPGKEYIYQYLVDGSIKIGDPYAHKVSDPWSDGYITSSTYPNLVPYPVGKTTGMATVFQTAQAAYAWQTSSFSPPDKSKLVIYELLTRDFVVNHTFQSVIDTLNYLKNLGINAIELMPVSEFEGNISWGYNPDFYFAVDKYYGPENNLKRLIDTCHSMGIAVISDIVLNHAFGSSPYVSLYWDATNNRPAANSPFYNPIAKHDFNVGYDMNHESPDTKYYVSNILKYWLEEFRFDGFRFDLSKGFTQNNTLGNTAAWAVYDPSRVAILSAYYDTIIKVKPGAWLILEHFADNTEEKILSNKGMMLWGNMNGSYRYASIGVTSGTNSDLSWGVYSSRGWSDPNLVTYMESHDEERQMYYSELSGTSSGAYNIKDTAVALDRMALNGAFFFLLPGPKMMWEFGERGYDYSINWPCMNSNCRLDPKPPRWDYMDQYPRKKLFFAWSEMIKLRTQEPVFSTTDFELDLSGTFKKIRLHDNNMSVVVLGNFGLTAGNIIPKFYQTGTWYDYFSGDSLVVTNINGLINLNPGEFRIYTSHKLDTPIGTEEIHDNNPEVVVYPNPSHGACNIMITGHEKTNCRVQIFDMKGDLISDIYNGIFDNKIQLVWTGKNKGIYLLKVESGNKVSYKKVIII